MRAREQIDFFREAKDAGGVYESPMRTSRLLPLLTLLVACGGPPPQPPITNLGPLPSATTAPPVAAPVDLSTVSEPRNLLVLVHVAKPAKLAGTLASWAGLPLPVGELFDEGFGDAVSPVLDTSQPVDVAVALETRGRSPRPVLAFSAAVRSVDDVKGALSSTFAFTPLANGAFRIEPIKNVRRDRDDDDGPVRSRPCVLAPSFGGSAARIVCGNKLASVDQMWPYLVRGATRVAATSDVHVELRADALRALFGDRTPFAMLMHEVSSEGPLALGLLSDLNDFGSDVDKVIIDANVDDAAGNGTATLSLRETKSAFSRMAVAHADRVGAPPASFLRLPVDSDAAIFSGGVDAKDLDHAKQTIAEGVAQRLETRQGLPAADSKAVQDVLKSTIDLLASPLVFAKGVDGAAATTALAAAKAAKPAAKTAAESAAFAALGGWDAMGVELPIAKVNAVAKDWIALLQKSGVAKILKSEAGDAPPLSMKAAPAPKGLPADSAHYTLTRGVVGWVTTPPPPPPTFGAKGQKPLPAPKPPKPPVFVNTLHLYLVPDGGRTWMVWSLDDALAQGKAKGLAGAPAQGATLTSRGGIDELKAARANSGGFVTMRGLVLDGPLVLLGSSQQSYLERTDPLRGFGGSGQGATPVSMWLAATSQTTMTATAHVPRGVVRDAIMARVRF